MLLVVVERGRARAACETAVGLSSVLHVEVLRARARELCDSVVGWRYFRWILPFLSKV